MRKIKLWQQSMQTNHHKSSLWVHRWILLSDILNLLYCTPESFLCFVTIVQLANLKWKLIISPRWSETVLSNQVAAQLWSKQRLGLKCASWWPVSAVVYLGMSAIKKSWVISSPQVINTPTPYSSAYTRSTHTSSFSRNHLQFPVKGDWRLKRGKRQVLASCLMGGKMGVSESIFIRKSLWALMCWRAEIIIWEMRKGMGLVKR